jgi:hypothetical protein
MKYQRRKEIQRIVKDVLESSMHLGKDNCLVRKKIYDMDSVNSEILEAKRSFVIWITTEVI